MYRILVNECRTYRVERLMQTGEVSQDMATDAGEPDMVGQDMMEWVLQMELSEYDGITVGPREFPSWDKAMAWIVTENEKPEWARKKNAWSVVEEVNEPCDE